MSVAFARRSKELDKSLRPASDGNGVNDSPNALFTSSPVYGLVLEASYDRMCCLLRCCSLLIAASLLSCRCAVVCIVVACHVVHGLQGFAQDSPCDGQQRRVVSKSTRFNKEVDQWGQQLSDMLEAEAAEYAAEAAAAELLEERTCEIYSVHTVPSA